MSDPARSLPGDALGSVSAGGPVGPSSVLRRTPLRAGVARSAYAERREITRSWLDRQSDRLGSWFRRVRTARGAVLRRLYRDAASHEMFCQELSEQELREEAARAGEAMRTEGFEPELVAKCFALTREAAVRNLGMRHHDVQLAGGWILLNGMVAEMETGEGKTLVATLAAGAAALAGIPTHVITVNDYLAKRDAENMDPVYRALGLTVGVIQHGMQPEERRAAYASDVTYCTNKELTFDYLRDRIALGSTHGRAELAVERLYEASPRSEQVVLRGLHYAIMDEADSVLIDESRTPLIISARHDDTAEVEAYGEALEIAAGFERDEDFEIFEKERAVEITEAGRERLLELTRGRGGLWDARLHREHLMRQALTALHIFHRDRDYLVKDDKVSIIDEFTGRVMADRSWEHGLHQMIETKEGVELTGRQDPQAKISYQRFFWRYLRLAGMTGTAREVAREMNAVYGLSVVRVPTNRPILRKDMGEKMFSTADEKWNALVGRVRELHTSGRPVLIGTRSVEASEEVSFRLEAAGLKHRVLNARQDEEEAEIVADAGEIGRITVATNMAGRGTDIALGPGVRDRGGLHVLATERHEAGRIDRQLFGRCGRQGDPGSFETYVSLEDEVMAVYGKQFVPLARRFPALGSTFTRIAQQRVERMQSRTRRQMLEQDQKMEKALAFSGRGE